MNVVSIKIYEYLLEPMLHRWKNRVAAWIANDSPGLTLDICCGTGKQCRLIAEHSPVVGLDLDFDLLKFAKMSAPHISFVCGDAGRLPFREGVFQNANISLALHDKPASLRAAIVDETRHCLRRDGHFFIIDFEQPHSIKSKIGYSFIYLIELMAGWDHFSNGRTFIKNGGQTAFAAQHALKNKKRHTSHWGSSSISMNRFDDHKI